MIASAGSDGIKSKLPKTTLATVISKIINNSTKQCKIPYELKIARITILDKEKGKHDSNNYRQKHKIAI